MIIDRRKFNSLTLTAATLGAFTGLTGSAVAAAASASSAISPVIEGDTHPPKFMAHEFAFFGIPTFWRLPHTRELQGVDIAVMCIPFDNGASNRAGTRLGPRAIREASLHLGNYQHPWVYDVKNSLKLTDYGTLVLGLGIMALAS